MKGNLGTGAASASERHQTAASELASSPPSAPSAPPVDTAPSAPEIPTPEPTAPSMDDSYEPAFFAKSVKTKAPEQPGSVSSESDPSPEAPPSLGVRKVKVDGKIVEVDMSRADIDDVLSLGLKGKKVFAERDKVQKQLKKISAEAEELRKYKTAMDKLEAVKDDEAALFKLITGRDLKDVTRKHQEEQEFFATAGPDEIKAYETAQRLERLEAERQRERETRTKETEAVEAREYMSAQKALKQRMATELRKVSMSGKVSDPVEAQELNEAIATKAIRNIKRYMAAREHLEEVPDALITREFARAAQFYDRYIAKAADQRQREIEAQKTAEATTSAQAASTANYQKPADEGDLKKFAGRMTKLWSSGFFTR